MTCPQGLYGRDRLYWVAVRYNVAEGIGFVVLKSYICVN